MVTGLYRVYLESLSFCAVSIHEILYLLLIVSLSEFMSIYNRFSLTYLVDYSALLTDRLSE